METHTNPPGVAEGSAVMCIISRSDIVRLITLLEHQVGGANT